MIGFRTAKTNNTATKKKQKKILCVFKEAHKQLSRDTMCRYYWDRQIKANFSFFSTVHRVSCFNHGLTVLQPIKQARHHSQ